MEILIVPFEKSDTLARGMGQATRFSHIGIAVWDIEKARKVYHDLFGYTVLSPFFEDLLQDVRVCFIGDPSGKSPMIELVAPISQKSPVRGVLDRGAGAYHIGYEVDDIENSIEDFRKKGCMWISGPTAAVAFGGQRIAWLYTPVRQLIELVEK